MQLYNFEQAKEYAQERLRSELSPNYYYHGADHTSADVVPAAARLAQGEGITGESRDLLLTAAWFHDLGFIETRAGHETLSARITEEALPNFGYSTEQIQIITGIIRATILPQAPTTILEQVMSDADLDLLGRTEDFMPRNADLRRELLFFGEEFTDLQWFTGQMNFVQGHTYFTATAHALRDAGKMKNLADVKNILESLNQSDLRKSSG